MNFDVSKLQQGMGMVSDIGGLLMGTINRAVPMAEIPENTIREDALDAMQQSYKASSYSDILNDFNSTRFLKTNYTTSDLLDMSDGEAAGHILLNGLQGGMAGAKFGTQIAPGIGTGIGFGVGTVVDTLASALAYEKRREKASNDAEQGNYLNEIANKTKINRMQENSINVGKNDRNSIWLNTNTAALGGPLDTTFTNGVRFINEGGSHEQNPLGGVLQGIAQDGLPNLVEEGEVVYNDYVYSKRLKVPDKDKEMLGLKKNKDYTYAEAATQIQKESEERPNDAISKRSLDEMMGRLQGSQEEYKDKLQAKRLKSAVNKMTPDELAMFIQQSNQPQQMQPMMAMQPMQPMQPTQSEVPMFAKGGILGHKHDGIDESYLNVARPIDKFYIPEYDPYEESSVIPFLQTTYTQGKTIQGGAPEISRDITNLTSITPQALRSATIWGNLIGAVHTLFDKPNYSNIARAERQMFAVPDVTPGHVGQKMAYTPLDINYLATQIGNQGLGARRALVERGAGPQSIIASNYGTQTALGDAIMKANQLNRQNLAQALEFNRGTDTTNIQNDLHAALANQRMAKEKADFLLQTGQLRDLELGKVQNNRSLQFTNLYQQLGNLGKDMLNRQMVKAGIEAGVFGNLGENAKNYNPILGYWTKCGGKLNTKKGGKHA